MYIEKLTASLGAVGLALLIWKAGNLQMLHFVHVCTAYAHAADAVAAWGN